jgi:hypothetical protein
VGEFGSVVELPEDAAAEIGFEPVTFGFVDPRSDEMNPSRRAKRRESMPPTVAMT